MLPFPELALLPGEATSLPGSMHTQGSAAHPAACLPAGGPTALQTCVLHQGHSNRMSPGQGCAAPLQLKHG